MNDHFFLASSISLFLLGAAFIIMSLSDGGIPVQTIRFNIEIDLNNSTDQDKIIDLLQGSHFINITGLKADENTKHQES
jgi:hypothetical protein